MLPLGPYSQVGPSKVISGQSKVWSAYFSLLDCSFPSSVLLIFLTDIPTESFIRKKKKKTVKEIETGKRECLYIKCITQTGVLDVALFGSACARS